MKRDGCCCCFVREGLCVAAAAAAAVVVVVVYVFVFVLFSFVLKTTHIKFFLSLFTIKQSSFLYSSITTFSTTEHPSAIVPYPSVHCTYYIFKF